MSTTRGARRRRQTLALVVVDEAVLALAGYELPDPLEHLLRSAEAPTSRPVDIHDHVVLGKPDLSRMQLRAEEVESQERR